MTSPMLLDALHSPLLIGGLLLIAAALYLQLTAQRWLDRFETAYKNGRIGMGQLDIYTWLVRWSPVIFTLLGTALLVFGLDQLGDVVEVVEHQEPMGTYYR